MSTQSSDYKQLYNSMLEAFDSINETYYIIELIFNENDEAVDFRYCEINSAVERLFSRKKQEIIGKTRNEIFGLQKDKKDIILETFEKIAKTGQPAHFESYGSGLRKYYDTYAWKIGNQIAVLSKDITERKKTEENLRISEEQKNNYLESIIDGFVALDNQWRYTYVNSKAEDSP